MEWKEVNSSVYCYKIADGTHDSPKKCSQGRYLITSKHVKGSKIDFQNAYFISEEDYTKIIKRSKVDQWDVIISMIGEYCGFCYLEDSLNTEYAVKNVGLLKVGEELKAKWLFYYLKSPKGKEQLYNQRAGSSQPYISLGALRNLCIPVCEETHMRNIVATLSSLDSKIETNNKINAQLEEIAQAIFKNWFVDFEPFKNGKFVESELGLLPEGWKVGTVNDIDILITDYVSNGSFASLKDNVKLYDTKEYAQFIRNTDLKSNSFKVYVDKHSYDFLSKSSLYGGEIIISNVGDVGSVFICPKMDIPMTLGNNIIMLRPAGEEYRYYLYLWYKYFYGKYLIKGITEGSAQPKFNKTGFKKLPLLLPPIEILEMTSSIFSSLYGSIETNQQENQRLASLRDTLLPKLMSGEIEI